MDEKTLETLEYPKILQRIAQHTAFNPSTEKAAALRPTNDLSEAQRLQAETQEAFQLLVTHPEFTIGGARDCRQQVDLASHGGVLAPVDLLDIKSTLIAGRTLVRGVELELSLLLPGDFDLTGNLTLQRAEDKGGEDTTYEGNKLPFLPETEALVRVKRPLAGWMPWLEVAHLGSNYRDRSNTELNKAPARTLLTLGIGRDWSPEWLGPAGVLSISGEVMNLTDNTVYDVEGFPLPGRSWHLAVQLRR